MKTKKIIIIGVIIIIILSIIVYFLYKNKNKKVTSILFIGDSNTNASFSYADRLRKMFPNLIINKISKDGANSDWMKGQIEQELLKNKYDVISILSGSNDIYGGTSVNVTKNNLDAMYNLAHARGSKVLAVTPPNKDFYVNKTDQKQALLQNLINWMKNNRNIDFFIDFHSITNNKSFFNSSDGYLHPQAPAHSILASQTAQKLNLK